MVEITYENVSVDAPLMVAASVLESAGYELVTTGDNAVIGFSIPHNFNGYCEAVVEFLPGVGLLQMTTSLTRGQVYPLLVDGLIQLLNQLNLMMPGVTFTYDHDEEEGDSIEISAVCFVFDEMQLEEQVKLMVRYLEESLKYSMPAIYQFVTQKLRFKADTHGGVSFVGPTVTVDQALEMVEMNQFGRA